jgi:transposase-like protein
MKKMGAPYGERHGKGKKYPDWLVKAVRMEHYDFGESVSEISRILSIPESTVRQWVNFYSRTHTGE